MTALAEQEKRLAEMLAASRGYAAEAGELMQHFVWQQDGQIEARTAARREELAGEIADVGILLFELADNLGLKLGEAMHSGATISFGMILTMILTFFVALGTITVLMKLIRHMSFLPFAIYRVALGVILLALIYSGMPLGAVN